MGRLTYNRASHMDIDDRALLHLQYVIGDKLRRGESFLFTWARQDVATPALRIVWINPRSTLVFSYNGSRVTTLNRAWLEALAHTANSVAGLYLVPEPPGEEFGTAGAYIERPPHPERVPDEPPAA